MGLLASLPYVFICLVSVFSIVALFFSFPLPPLPSDFDFRRSFQPRARRRALTSHSFAAFNLDNRTPFAYDAVWSVGGGTILSTFGSLFPHLSLSLRSVHCIAMDSDLDYRYPRLALLKASNRGPHSPISFACVSGQQWPIFSLFISACIFLVSLAIRSNFSHRHSTSRSANPCVLPSRYHILDRRAVIRCGSGDNNPPTPLPSHSRARSPFGNVAFYSS